MYYTNWSALISRSRGNGCNQPSKSMTEKRSTCSQPNIQCTTIRPSVIVLPTRACVCFCSSSSSSLLLKKAPGTHVRMPPRLTLIISLQQPESDNTTYSWSIATRTTVSEWRVRMHHTELQTNATERERGSTKGRRSVADDKKVPPCPGEKVNNSTCDMLGRVCCGERNDLLLWMTYSREEGKLHQQDWSDGNRNAYTLE